MVFKGQHRKRLTKKGLLDQLPDPKNQIMIRNSQRGHSSDRENNNTQNGLKSQNGNFQRKHQSGHLNGHQNGHLIVHQNGHQNIHPNGHQNQNNTSNNHNYKRHSHSSQNKQPFHTNNASSSFRGGNQRRRGGGNGGPGRSGTTPNRRNGYNNRVGNKRKTSSDLEEKVEPHLPSIEEQLNTTNDSFENLELVPNYVPSDGVNLPPMSSSTLTSRRLRASSPTPSTWSLSTTATFKHDLRDSQFQDMVETFRENDLNNMQKSQILQEYLFMERVNAFLEEKLMNLPTYEDKSDHEIECKKAKLDSSDTGSDSAKLNQASVLLDGTEETTLGQVSNQDSSKPTSKTQENDKTNSNSDSKIDSTTYHHGRYELDLENGLDAKPLTTDQQNTISCLNQLGIDPINNVDSIQEHLEIIELQVDERRRQLEEENKSLNEKLQELMKGLSEVIKESVENHAGFEKSCVKVTTTKVKSPKLKSSPKMKSPVAKT